MSRASDMSGIPDTPWEQWREQVLALLPAGTVLSEDQEEWLREDWQCGSIADHWTAEALLEH